MDETSTGCKGENKKCLRIHSLIAYIFSLHISLSVHTHYSYDTFILPLHRLP